MKLSMWMIANRLSSLDPELEIEENAPVSLNSARRAYATNCVHIYQSGDSVVCNGEGNIIRIRNMSETQAFEIVQGVFDYYTDWLDCIFTAARARDFQAVVDHAWKVFCNPLILMDANNRVLGISRYYEADEMDQEWNYLCDYGYSSLNSIHKMRYDFSNIDFTRHGLQSFRFTRSQPMNFDGVSYCLTSNEYICGRITLLAKDRPLNTGDYQLLQVIASVLEPILGQNYQEHLLYSSSVFYKVLFSEPYDEESLNLQLDYQQWKKTDTYQLAVICLQGNVENDNPVSIQILVHALSQQLPRCVILQKNSYLLVLANWKIADDPLFLQMQKSLIANNPIQIGFSLPCKGINRTNYLFSQAQAAIRYGSIQATETRVYRLENYAIEYILSVPTFAERLHACCPSVRELWEMEKENNQEMYETLKCYLDNERSVTKTSAALFAHRNTVLYRIKKIQDLLNESLDNAYVRDYIRLSIRILELCENTL